MFILSSALSLQCTPVTSAHLKQELPSIPGALVVRMWHWAFSRRLRLPQFPAWGQLLVFIALRSGPVCGWPTSLLSISWRQMALHSLPVNWHGQATYASTVSLPSRASFNTPSSILFFFNALSQAPYPELIVSFLHLINASYFPLPQVSGTGRSC